jgi:hypothetical protein
VWLHLADIPKLGVALPTSHGHSQLVAFPLALPMGWVESPPFFTTITVTPCDLAIWSCVHAILRVHTTFTGWNTWQRHRPAIHHPNTNLHAPRPLHTSGAICISHHWLPSTCTSTTSFLMAQTQPQRRRVLHATLHAIDDVLRPLAPTDPTSRKEPSST